MKFQRSYLSCRRWRHNPLPEAKDSSGIVNIVTTTDKMFQHAHGDGQADAATREIIYTPPEGEQRLRDLLANWERLLHDAVDIRVQAEHTTTFVRERASKIYSRERVDVIFEQPYCRIANLVEKDISQRQAAFRYLKALVDLGVLREIQVGKEKLFIHPKLMRLLTREAQDDVLVSAASMLARSLSAAAQRVFFRSWCMLCWRGAGLAERSIRIDHWAL